MRQRALTWRGVGSEDDVAKGEARSVVKSGHWVISSVH
jgi:hypothetical protein